MRLVLISIEEVDVLCKSGTIIEEYAYTFPKGFEIISKPENTKFEGSYIKYYDEYNFDKNKLEAKRNLVDSTPGNICKPELMKKQQDLSIKINNNINSQLVYKH